MGKKLYVGNLPFSATEGTVSDYFNQIGAVDSVRLITDRESGRSKGFAFVEMSSDELAEEAIRTLDGKDFEGRPLRVNEAREREFRPSSGGGYGGGGGGWGGSRCPMPKSEHPATAMQASAAVAALTVEILMGAEL